MIILKSDMTLIQLLFMIRFQKEAIKTLQSQL